LSLRLGTDDPVWYVAYGSNMNAARFGCYLSGGRPRGAARTYLGCRDRSPPRRDAGIHLAGGVLSFAGASLVWGGGIAFFDTHTEGELAARAYLVTFGQLSDVVSQEVRRPACADMVLDSGVDRWTVPTDHDVYDTLVHVGDRGDLPMFTITSCKWLEPTSPSAPYLRFVLDGLRETFGWTAQECADYLLQASGVAKAWTAAQLVELCDGGCDR
jgi:hypothetical protein